MVRVLKTQSVQSIGYILKGYEIASLKVDGKEVVNPSNTYTFTNVTSGHTIDVSFKEQAVVPPAVEAPTITKQP